MSADAIRLEPAPGRDLRDLLFERGVEFPCGGAGLCGGCKIRVLAGDIPITPEMRAVLTDEELRHGWRLGCLAQSDGPVALAIDQWSVHILDDRSPVAFKPATGYGIVVDVGTTTLVAQLVDRTTGEVAGVETALNPQAAQGGSDLMSRIRCELERPGTMTEVIRDGIGGMVASLAGDRLIEEVLLVGNTVMHHLFGGLDVRPLAAVPFRPLETGELTTEAGALRWPGCVSGPVRFLPCVGGFVGSDLVAGVVAIGLAESDSLGALLDLGTNGEIALGDSRGVLCVSTAAGPAFEGGRIGQGMRAGLGAIDAVRTLEGGLACSVIGGVPARGICGSGLVDAVAAGLELGWIAPSGRVRRSDRLIPLADGVALSQSDIRELQLAKGAVAAGFELLRQGRNLEAGRVHLAGAFGNYIRAESARTIGLLPNWVDAPVAAGNAALRGARRILLAGSRRQAILEAALSRMCHVELASDPGFADAFAEHMRFPGSVDA